MKTKKKTMAINNINNILKYKYLAKLKKGIYIV